MSITVLKSDLLTHVFVFIFVSIIVFVNFIGCRNILSYCKCHLLTTSSALFLHTYSLSTLSQDIVISFLFLWFRLLSSIIQLWKDLGYISIDITRGLIFYPVFVQSSFYTFPCYIISFNVVIISCLFSYLYCIPFSFDY